MKAEGLDNIFARHERQKQASRAAMKALGLPLLAPDNYSSPAVTSVIPDSIVSAEDIRSTMRKQFDIALAGGQDHLKGKIFRIGHLGFVCDRDILATVASLETTLQILGYEGFAPGSGVSAASQVLR